ncbi:HNH endonuclease [Fontibacillus phaseoli]|uniref:HNH endonuclease n=1 Tax=Fontibacillus phaseoli TaxID=1416533 RepID=A0A369BQS1_9BACL|nr:HNH endonuclease [Fontibacillus phaseoli]RCX22946.1 HNH endonuclease [Fontibacillus phaseoli]
MSEKRCTKCGETKGFDKFYKKKATTDGYRSECKECTSQVNKRYREDNTAKVRQIQAEYRKNNRDLIKQNGAVYRAANRSAVRERVRRWKIENPEKARENKVLQEQRRRSRMRGLPAAFTRDEWETCLSYFGHSCAYCGEPEADLQQDHVIPVSAGGGYVAENIIPACKSCNSSKRHSDYIEWFMACGQYSDERALRISRYLSSLAGRGRYRLLG